MRKKRYTVVLDDGNGDQVEYLHVEGLDRDAAIDCAQEMLAELNRSWPDETLNPARHEPLLVFRGWHRDADRWPADSVE